MSDPFPEAMSATGLEPTAEFRTALRDALIAEAGGAGSGGEHAPPETHRTWPILAAVAGVIALLVGGLVVVSSRSNDNGTVTATLDDALDTLPPVEPTTIDPLIGRRWIDLDTPGALLTTLDVEPTRLGGFDGCRAFGGPATYDGTAVATLRYAADIPPCGDDTFAYPEAGDRLVRTSGLELRAPDGSVRATYVDAATLATVTDDELTGTWVVDDVEVVLGADHRLSMSTCVFEWDLDGADLSLTGASEPGRCSVSDPGPLPDAATKLLRSVFGGAVTVRRSSTDTIVVDDGEFAVRLTRRAGAGDDPDDGDHRSVAESLAGTRWVATSVTGPPLTNTDVPFLRFRAFAQPLITGFDGCNRYEASGTIDAGEPIPTVTVSVTVGELGRCYVPSDEQQRAVRPADGDTITRDGAGTEITFSNNDRIVTYRSFESFDAATRDALTGRWLIDADTRDTLSIDDVTESITVGSCAVGWTLDSGVSRLTTDGWPDDPLSCIDDPTGLWTPEAAAVVTALASGGDVRLDDDGSLVLATDERVHRLPRFGAPIDVTGIVFANGAAFGYRPHDQVDPDDAVTHVGGHLGPPTHDTGWFVTETFPSDDDTEDCLGGRTTRTLWWDDFALSFWDLGQETVLWAWSVGDVAVTGWGDRREPYAPSSDARSLLTTGGDAAIGVGSTIEELMEIYGDRLAGPGDLYADGSSWWSSTGSGWGLSDTATVLTRDGVVTGFGSAIGFC